MECGTISRTQTKYMFVQAIASNRELTVNLKRVESETFEKSPKIIIFKLFLMTLSQPSHPTVANSAPSIATVLFHFFIVERKSLFPNRLEAINVYHFLHTPLQYLFHQSHSTLREISGRFDFMISEELKTSRNASISSSARLKWIIFSRTIIVESILQHSKILQSRMFSSIEEQSRGETKQIKSGRRREKNFSQWMKNSRSWGLAFVWKCLFYFSRSALRRFVGFQNN